MTDHVAAAPTDGSRYLMHRIDSGVSIGPTVQLDKRYRVELWRPSVTRIVPTGMALVPFGAIWWLMHVWHVFWNRDYSAVAVYDGHLLVHHTILFPPYARFPFMRRDDINVGETWTHPAHRGRGLAVFGIQEAVRMAQRPGRRFWYIHRKENEASRRAVVRAGLEQVGTGTKRLRFGSSALGVFEYSESVGD